MILDFNKKKTEYEYKKAVIFEAFKNFFKELRENEKVKLPYFIEAQTAYNDNIKTLKDVNKWYERIMNESN